MYTRGSDCTPPAHLITPLATYHASPRPAPVIVMHHPTSRLEGRHHPASITLDLKPNPTPPRPTPQHVDIFAKDFLFVPIHEALHWSLAIVCHPGRWMMRGQGAEGGDAVILHLDSLAGGWGQEGGQQLVDRELAQGAGRCTVQGTLNGGL